MSQVSVSRLIDQINALPPLKRKAVLAGVVDSSQPVKIVEGQKAVIWHGIPVVFVPSQYLSKPQQIWLLASLFGSDRLKQVLKKTRMMLDSRTIERLFEKSTLQFFINSEETYLLSAKNELTEADFGPLQSVEALDVLKRFGLESAEAAKEKGYVRLQQ